MAEATLTPEQHAIRARGIGSSDAAAAVGLSPWKTPVQLWLEKTRRVEPEALDGKEIIEFGNVMEEVVSQMFQKRRGLKVQRKRVPYERDIGTLHMVANIDRQIVGEDAGAHRACPLECKNVGEFAFMKWDEKEPPEHYRIQTHHQMITMEKREIILAAVVGGNRYVDFEISWHQDLADHLIAKETEFWNCVLNDVAPEPTSAADVVALYPVDSGKVIIASPELRELHADLMSIRGTYKRIGEKKEYLEDQIKMLMGEDAEVVLSEGGKPIVTWKAAKGSKYAHYKDMWAEASQYIPAEEYARIEAAHSGTYAHGSRRFLPKEVKE